MKKFKDLSVSTRASIAYTIANFVSKGVSVITVPIFTRLLTTSEIGIGTTYSAWYSILYTLVTLSLSSGSLNIAMMEFKEKRNEYESACLTLTSISCAIFAAFYFCLKDQIKTITGLSESVMIILILGLFINPALDFWYARQRYEYKYLLSVIVSVGITILTALMSVIAIFVFRNNAFVDLGEVKVISQGSVLISASLVVYIYIMAKGKVYINLKIWKYALGLSLPLILHSLSKSVLDLSDRLMISFFCGQAKAGIYGTVYSLSMLSLIVWNAINAAMIPVTFENLENNRRDKINQTMQVMIMIFAGIAILITLLAPEILQIFTTNAYFEAMYLVPALSAGIYFTALYNMYGNFLLYRKKTVYIMFGTVIAAGLNLILNFIFINTFGYIAAAYTTLVSFVVLALMQCLMCKKVYGLSVVDDKRLLVISVVVALFCLACNFIYNYFLLRYLIIGIIVWVFILKRKVFLKILFLKRNHIK